MSIPRNAVFGQLRILREPEISASAADSAIHAKGRVDYRSLLAIDTRVLEPQRVLQPHRSAGAGRLASCGLSRGFDRLRGIADLYPLACFTAKLGTGVPVLLQGRSI